MQYLDADIVNFTQSLYTLECNYCLYSFFNLLPCMYYLRSGFTLECVIIVLVLTC